MKRIVIIALSLFLSVSGFANWQMDAYALKAFGHGGTGDFNPQAISVNLLGTVRAAGCEFPDLLVETDTWYPGARYYKYVRHNDQGVPVFKYDGDISMCKSIKEGGSTTCLVQDGEDVKLFWYTIDTLNVAQFDAEDRSFDIVAQVPFPKMKYKPKAMFVEKMGKYGYRVWYGAQDRWGKKPPGNHRVGEYFPFDGAGIWRGGFTYMGLYCVDLDENYSAVNEPVLCSSSEQEVLQTYCKLSRIGFDKSTYGILGGSYMGGMYFYKQKGKGVNMAERAYVVDKDGIAQRHPGIACSPISYPSPCGASCDIIASCEGGLYFYQFSGNFTEQGCPVYSAPVPVQEEDALLYGGSLPVPTVVDWDGDGLLDIVSGNSQGFIQFFKNNGTNESPKFDNAVNLKSLGHTIQVQPGYGEDIQGPLEARWGYTCPNVVDWNGDGHLDVLFGDSRGKNMILRGIEGPVEDRLDLEHPIYCYDLDLHGTWRARPGISKVGGTMYLATLDDDNELHLYSRTDVYNLKDMGKIKLKDGRTVVATVAASGGTGRLKVEIVDWDGDGKQDIILGTCKHHSVMGDGGLPEKYHKKNLVTLHEDDFKSYGRNDVKLYGPVYYGSGPDVNPASFILFMKNVGTNEHPVYNYPTIFRFKGEKIKLGQHSIGVCAAMLGDITDGLPNLFVSDERGRFYLLDRKDLTW